MRALVGQRLRQGELVGEQQAAGIQDILKEAEVVLPGRLGAREGLPGERDHRIAVEQGLAPRGVEADEMVVEFVAHP